MRYSLPSSNDRKSIFNHPSRMKKFQTIYQTILPDFIEKYDECQCLHRIEPCPKVLSLFVTNSLNQAEEIYNSLRDQAEKKQQQFITNSYKIDFCQKIFEPHLKNLLKVIQVERVQPLYEILRHAKYQYLAFWTYSVLCEHWPSFQEFKVRVLEFVKREKLDVGELDRNMEYKLSQLYQCKLANISHENYMKVIKLIFEKSQFLQKMAAISLTRGRQRREDEILKATLQY